MPTLANIDGRTLVSNVAPAAGIALQGFGTPQSRAANTQSLSQAKQDQQIQAQQAQAQQAQTQQQAQAINTINNPASTPKQQQAALTRLASINPSVANAVQGVIQSGNQQALDALKAETDKGVRTAKQIKSIGSFVDRQKAIGDLAASAIGRGEDITRLVELSNMSEDQLDTELERMLVQGTDIKTLTDTQKPFTLSEGQTRFDAAGNPIAAVAEQVETFTPVKNAQGKIVGQQSSLTGKVIEDPRAVSAKVVKPKFENFVDSEGDIVAFDTNSPEGAALAAELVSKGGRKALATDATPTVDQGKNAGFAIRSQSASETIDELGTNFTGFSDLGQRVLPNVAKSKERQLFEQAERNLINSVLRKESGAVISEEEFDNARKQYIPQPGDSSEVLDQKAQNRRQIIAGMRASAGKGALTAAEEELQNLEATPSSIPEGQTATNPSTGQKIIFRNGSWQPL